MCKAQEMHNCKMWTTEAGTQIMPSTSRGSNNQQVYIYPNLIKMGLVKNMILLILDLFNFFFLYFRYGSNKLNL